MRAKLRLARIVALQLIAATLAACGGGGGGGGAQSQPPPPDRTPNAFSFAPVAGAQEGALVESPATAVTGFDSPASIAISGGEYSISGGTFTTSPGTISPGQTVSVRVAAPAAEDTTASATVTIGGVSGTFNVKSADRTPSDFSFTSIERASLGATVESEAVAITGFDSSTSIAVSGGEYSVAGAPFTTSAGTLLPNDSVAVRVTAAASPDTAVEATLTIGGVSGTFTVTTVDTIPEPFTFSSIDRVPLGAGAESEAVSITGIDSDTPIAVAGGEYSIEGGPFTSDAGTIAPGETVALRVTAAGTPDTTVEAELTIGGVSGMFAATTIDTIPDAFAFSPAVDVPRSVVVESNAVTIAGIDVPTPVSVSGGEYSIDGTAFTAVPGDIEEGQTVRVRLTSSPTPGGVVDAVLTVGEGSAAFEVTSSTDVEPPTGSFVYPLPVSRTSADEIILRGTASDTESAIQSVQVNGIDAVSDDDFATWTATVPLAPGPNALVLALTDTKLNTDNSAAQVWVRREPMFGNVSALSYDAANDRLIVADPNAAALFTVDSTTGLRSVLSNPLTPNSAEIFSWIYDVAVDEARNRALVASGTSVGAVNLTTGERGIIAANLSPSGSLRSIAVDDAGQRAFVLDGTGPRILAIDLIGGFVTVLSDPTTPDAQNLFTNPQDLAVDAANGRLLVSDSSVPAIYAVDLTSGARSIFSSNTIPDAVNPFVGLTALAIDAANNRVLVTQGINDSVLAVDLITGARTVWSDPTTPDTVSPFATPRHIAVDADDGRAFVFDERTRDIQSVDLGTGGRMMISAQEPASAGPRIRQPHGVVHDPTSDTLLVANTNPPAVVVLDLGTSARTTLSDNVTPNDINEFTGLYGIEFDAANDLIYVSDSGDTVFKVFRSTGLRAILSSNSFPDGLNPFSEPRGLAIDLPGNRLLVAEFSLPGVIAVDLTSGARSIVSSNAAPAGIPEFLFPTDLVLDTVNDRAVVTTFNGIFNVSLSTGSRSVFSSQTVPPPGNPSSRPHAIAWDAPRNRFIVSDAGIGSGFRVLAVDAATGQATELSPLPTTLTVNRLSQADGIAVDSDAEIAFVTDWPFGVVVAVDLRTGERVYLTH